MQSYNRRLFRTILDKKITLIDYECMEHEDGQRILGFGFFAGIVGAHNGMMAYGNRTKEYTLPRVYRQPNFKQLIHGYFGIRLPNIKVVITGSGRVAHGSAGSDESPGHYRNGGRRIPVQEFCLPGIYPIKRPALIPA